MSRVRGLRTGGLVLAATVGCLVLAPLAGAKDYVVTKRTDPVPGACTKSDCSLREAIRAANAHPGLDRILLPSRLRYELARPSTGEDGALDGDLDITNSGLKIIHPGKGLATIDANGIDRVFNIFVGAPTRLVKLKITGGSHASSDDGSGGGILTYANLTVTDSIVTRNRAVGSSGMGGGIKAAAGKLTILRSTISRNVADDTSGAIDVVNNGVVIQDSVVTRNRADFAGMSYMYGDGVSKIVRSTISKNRSTGEAGALYFSESAGSMTILNSTFSGNVAGTDSGAISARNGTMKITNSTVANNRAGANGGGIWVLAPLELNSVTVARNVAAAGAGLYNAGNLDPFTVRNSLIALNKLTGGARNDCAGDPITSLGHNLISTTGPAAVCTWFTQPGDLLRANPRIGLLKANGGRTLTIALASNSPARNRADSTSPKRDQRGVKRVKPDIGAFERH